jgi:propionyl-CoA carboxylase alpha chain
MIDLINIMKKITKILIANRGEIAVRVIKSAKKMGIKTVAVCSDADANALFVKMADEVVPLGGNLSKESYLIIDKIIDACKKTGADAVHPGYGFLSENHNFVNRLNQEGIIFIGPSVKSMEMMGDKVTSKKCAQEANVSVVPGFLGIIETDEEALKIAKEIGFPIIIKASAGGGGKGMKIVYDEKDVIENVRSAKNEARNSFGDDRVFIEKYVEDPRHIEIQIIGDQHGNIVCLGERECSIQRFNQKFIEESPSSFVDEATRKKMYEQSYKLAKHCGYFSAGTVEYIMDKDKNFYFLEMNTRLQVEHPVTEYVTGLDLVELMINVANGEKLPFKQEDIKLSGHAMEVRICAEDPTKNFMPSVGRISKYKEPKPMHNVISRIDTGIVEGSEISPYYDSMVSKVITYGDSRKEAIDSMKEVLGRYEIEGITTNMNLVDHILRDPDFVSGNISTSYVKKKYPNGFKLIPIENDVIKNFLCAAIAVFVKQEEKMWSHSSGYRLKRDEEDNNLTILIDKTCYNIHYEIIDSHKIKLFYNGEKEVFTYEYENGSGVFSMCDDKQCYASVKIKKNGNKCIFTSQGLVSSVMAVHSHVGDYFKYIKLDSLVKKPKTFDSPLAGTIVKIMVKDGDSVVEGQPLMLIEAMKMENVIKAEFDVKIEKVLKSDGDKVMSGDTILKFSNS